MEKDPKDCPTSLCIQNLPYEVLTMIFSELSVHDIFNVILTCKKFRDVVSHNNTIWKRKSVGVFLVTSNSSLLGSSKEHFPYHQCRISYNWQNGYFKEKIIAQSNIKYMPWLSLHPEHLIHSTGYVLTCYPRDKRGLPHSQKNIWKITVPRVERRGVRTNDISRFVAKDDLIICGNRDGCIAVYDMHNKTDPTRPPRPHLREHILDCHKSGMVEVSAVECTRLCEDLCVVISGSGDDSAIHFWRDDVRKVNARRFSKAKGRKGFQCIRSVEANIEGARSMKLDRQETKLAVGLKSNSRPLLIDVETGRLIYNPEATVNYQECVRDITWLDDNVTAFVGHTGFLTAFDWRTGRIVYNNQDPMASSLYSLHTDGRHAIVTGTSQLSRCVLYDVRNCRSFVQLFFTQKCSSPVYSLAFDANVLTAAMERSVAVLNFNVNMNGTRQRDYATIVRSFR